MDDVLEQTSTELVSVAQSLHARGWLLGTSGNLSAVLVPDPLLLAITPSGADKGELSAEQILTIDEHCQTVKGSTGKPSDESALHVAIVQARNAGAVIHTHSVWSTMLSDVYEDGIAIEGFEMLKGLTGVITHEHSEWIPVVDNSQEMQSLAATIEKTLANNREAHAVILRRHGLYTWGKDLHEAKRHIEILEFLLEVVGRRKVWS